MILVTYSYKVPQELLDEYLEATHKRMKPFWEGRGCRYEVYRQKDDASSFLKLMFFEDEETFRKNLLQKDQETSEVVALFRKFAQEVNRKVFKKVT